MSVYVIGDLQGCHARLIALLEKIHAQTADPKLVFIGDLVNRGPDSLATLRLIRSFGANATALLGNHDLHLLAVACGVRKPNKSDTLDAILQAPDRDELLDWLRHRPLAHLENNFLMVHAGVLPQWSTQQTIALAGEVERILRGPDWSDFAHDMYGNTPTKWNDALTGAERIRCIINALTRMRFCTPDGSMEFSDKSANGTNLAGHLPWFDLPGRATEDVTVVFGHWSALGMVLRPNLIGLDTGCVWGGKLTALRLEDRALFQVECPQYQKPD